jgi:CRISP-associated protein Cas1
VSWRSVTISNPARLRRDHFGLRIEQEDVAHVPFEDIAVIVLDHPQISLTQPLLAACAEYGVAMFTTDETHTPAGVFLPFQQHTRCVKMLRLQLALSRPRTKQAHAALIRAKLLNQARCLELAGHEGHARLRSYANRVRSGDPENLEAQGSAFYFPALFGKGFRRSDDNAMNASLNYGYAILRAAVARSLVAHGLHPAKGLFHDSEQNAFNLADDLLEPFRPIVDLQTVELQGDGDSVQVALTSAQRAKLVALLHHDVQVREGVTSVLSAIEGVVESLCRYLQEEGELELPQLIPLAPHDIDC